MATKSSSAMQILYSLELLIAILSSQISLQRYAEYLEWAKKISDRVFGCNAVVEVALIGIGDEDVDNLPKKCCYGINRPEDETD